MDSTQYREPPTSTLSSGSALPSARNTAGRRRTRSPGSPAGFGPIVARGYLKRDLGTASAHVMVLSAASFRVAVGAVCGKSRGGRSAAALAPLLGSQVARGPAPPAPRRP